MHSVASRMSRSAARAAVTHVRTQFVLLESISLLSAPLVVVRQGFLLSLSLTDLYIAVSALQK